MITRSINFPKQRYSFAYKMKKQSQWGKDCLDALALQYTVGDYERMNNKKNLGDSSFSYLSPAHERYNRNRINYDLYNNKVDSSFIEDWFNPMGIEVGQIKQDVSPYNKGPNKINLLVGDEIKRPSNYRAFIQHGDGVNSALEFLDSSISEFISSAVDMNMMRARQELMQGTQPESEEEAQQLEQQIQQLADSRMDPKTISQYMKTKYVDAREISTNKLLQYILESEDIITKRALGFKHANIAGEEIIYVGKRGNKFGVHVINPLSFFYSKTPDVQMFEDGMFAGTRVLMTVSDILSKYGEYLSDKDVERLEKRIKGAYNTIDKLSSKMEYGLDYDPLLQAYNDNLSGMYREGNHGFESNRSDMVVVYHVEWVSETKEGFLKFINEYGDEDIMRVDENFVVPDYATKEVQIDYQGKRREIYHFDGMSLEWHWLPEVWEGTKIDDNIYCCIGPKEHQFRSKEDPYKVKLGYHGCAYNNTNGTNMSTMEYMKPFLILYIVVANKLVRLISKDKGIIFPIDTSMIDPKIGIEKTLYYLNELDLYPYNSLQNAESPGAAQRSGAIEGGKSMSNMQHIANYVQLLESIDAQISDVAGIPKSREGQTSPNQAVTNSQQDIVQSSSITELKYLIHDKIWASVYQSCISYYQKMIKEEGPMTFQFLLDDLSLQSVKISPDDLEDIDFGVFINNSGRQVDIFNRLRALGEVMLNGQNSKMSDLITLYKSNSIEEIHNQIKESEQEAQEEIQAQRDHEVQMAEQAKQAEIEKMQIEHQFNLEEIAAKGEIDKELKEIDSFKFQRDQDLDNNGIPDQLEIDKLRSQEAIADLNARVKMEDIKSKERIAKQKPQST